MKQFIVFIHSNFSKASIQCESIIKTLPSDLNINFLSIDNTKTRATILQDSKLDIKMVPTILVVDTKGKVSKFEGKTCFDYLSQFEPPKKHHPIILQSSPPTPKQPIIKPPPPQELPPNSSSDEIIPQPPPQQQLKKPKKPLPVVKEPINFDEDLFNSQPPSDNITSIALDDDEDEPPQYNHPDLTPPTPVPPPQKNYKQQQQQQQQKNQKNNIVAQAQAMQKSRLQDDEFSKKNH